MCGRFGASFQYREIKAFWNLSGDFSGFFPRYNIAPSQDVPVIVRNDGRNELRPMRWDWCRLGHKTRRSAFGLFHPASQLSGNCRSSGER
jgi:putative SOS response-associated peptidase YedK